MNIKKSFILFLFISMFPLFSCDPNAGDPTADARDKFIGTWNVQETGKKKINYQVQITADPSNSVQVFISNFYNFGIKPYAIATTNTLTVPQQVFSTEGIRVWGSGSYSSNTINWVYYVNDGANQDTIHSVYTLQ